MPTYKTEAIVIKRTNLGEADRIITFLSPTEGKFKAVARGVRRIKARMAGHLELFSRTGLMVAKGRRLDVITSARLVSYPESLLNNFGALQKGYLLAEIVDKLLDEHEPHPDSYSLLQECLQALSEGADPAGVELYFRLRLLDDLGYRPVLQECVVCHAALGEERLHFDPELGGIVGSECRPGALAQAMSTQQLRDWQGAYDSSLHDWLGDERQPQLSAGKLEQFYGYVFGKQFKAAQLLG